MIDHDPRLIKQDYGHSGYALLSLLTFLPFLYSREEKMTTIATMVLMMLVLFCGSFPQSGRAILSSRLTGVYKILKR